MARIKQPISECQACGGPVWDNRESKRSPKQPDFKCKDRDGCGEAYWLDGPKGQRRQQGGNGKAPLTWNQLAAVYRKSREVAAWAWGEGVPPEVLSTATATVFIQAMKDGMTADKPKPAPPPPPPEPEPEDEDDGLPF